MFDFEYHIKNLPDKPGVYLMKNSLGEVIYVGKAKVLKNRVKSYFQKSKNHSEKVKVMVKNIAEFEYIVTDSEMEALILECNLIKKYSPKYNILLKDDKFYPFIKITVNDDYPRVFVTRRFAKDGSKYFGPYTNGSAVYETLDLIYKIFPLRNCKLVIKENGEKVRPCLNYHIKKCLGPCGGHISKEEYGKMINDIIDILSGKETYITKMLKSDMEKAAEELEFEKAASLRDKILSINAIAEKQKIFKTMEGDEDFINIEQDEKDSCIQVFFSRDGKVIGREHFIFENTANEGIGEIIEDFIGSFYGGTAKIPKAIYVPQIDNFDLMEEYLTIKRGSKVWIKVPQKGQKKEMLEMVKNNARITLEKFKDKYLKDKESDCYLTSHLYVVSEVTKLQRGLDRIGSKYGFKTTFKDLRNMYKERCLKSCMDMNILMELLGVQSLKLNLPENYKSSNEEKKRQVNKL